MRIAIDRDPGEPLQPALFATGFADFYARDAI